MSELKDMLLDVVEKMLKKHVDKETVDLLEDGLWGEQLWQMLEKNDVTKVAWQQSGGDLEDLLLLYERMGYYAAPVPFVEQTLANVFLEQVGAEPVEALLTYVVDAGHLTCADGVVNGTIPLVRWGRLAKQLVVLQENVLWLVDCEGSACQQRTNLAAEPRDTLTFENAKASVYPLRKPLAHYEALESAALVASITGAITRAVDLTVQFTKERKQFGQPIHRFQLVQQHIAILAGEQAIAVAALENSINQLFNHQIHAVLFARMRLDDAARIVTTSAHQVHAAIGVTYEHALHHTTRRLWAWRDEGQSIEAVCTQMAEQLLASDEDVWSLLTKGDV